MNAHAPLKKEDQKPASFNFYTNTQSCNFIPGWQTGANFSTKLANWPIVCHMETQIYLNSHAKGTQ